MRTIVTCILTAVLMLSFTNDAEAQLLKRLKNKAADAAAKKAEEKLAAELERRAQQMVEKSWNSIFGDVEENNEGKTGSPFFKMNSNVKTEDSYHFNTVTTMKIETVKSDGKSDPPALVEMHFNDEGMYTGSKFSGEDIDRQDGDVFIIYDFKNSSMIMLMNAEDDKFSIAYDWEQSLQQNEMLADNTSQQEIDWQKTEEWKGYTKMGTKDIAGYSCEGYRSESDYAITEVWVTREASFGMPAMFQANANAKQLRGKVPSEYPSGMLMEIETKDLESGDKTIMKVTDIKENANVTYTMSDYPVMSFGTKK